MIGGSGEKMTLRMVAELADLCNIGGTAHGRRQEAGDPRRALRGRRAGSRRGEADRDGQPVRLANERDRTACGSWSATTTAGDARDRMIIATADEATEQPRRRIVAAGADEVIVNLPLIKSVDAIHTAADVLQAATS